jgi:uroporphyrinogen-III decarboxylase
MQDICPVEISLQGNFDPSRLLSPIPVIKKMVNEMIDEFGKRQYIANLGHGILPNIPVDHAKAFVDSEGIQAEIDVKQRSSRRKESKD